MRRNALTLAWSAASAATLALMAAWPHNAAIFAADQTGDQAAPKNQATDQGNQENEPAAERSSPPRDVIVVLNDGQRLRGSLVAERPDHIVLRIANIETRLPRDEVDQIIVQPPLLERYQSMREAIDDDDVDRLLPLIEWLRVNGLYEQAMNELRNVLNLEPKNGEALRLRRLVEQQMSLREKTKARQSQAKRGRSVAPPDRTGRSGRPRPGEFPLLSEEQVNLIKVYEIDLDNPPRLVIDRATVDRLLEEYAGQAGAPVSREAQAVFHRKPTVEILKTMFRLRARELYGRVQVRELPESLRRFRDHVNAAWLVNACATTRCHGGTEAGRLMLYNRQPRTDRAAVTNFLILERFRLADGASMIDYEQPQRSPLIQMTLPREDAAHPHPKVYGWRPIFYDLNADRLEQAIEWIESMHQPRPEYPIAYEPPRPPEPETVDAEPEQDR